MTRSPFLLLPAAFLLALLAGCSSGKERLQALVTETRPTGVKVLLIGIDGASPALLHSFLEEKRLPAFAALIGGGSEGTLKSLEPTVSPAIWTTIVTGRRPADHGIDDFTRRAWVGFRRKSVMVSSADRKVPALWNIAGPFGRTVGFTGWWASWPAEPVKGFMVSDRFARSRFTVWTHAQRDSGLTFPADLSTPLQPLLMDPLEPPLDEIESMADFDAAEMAEFQAAQKPVYAHGMSVFKFSYAEQRTYERVALSMLRTGQPDLAGIFLVANDPICHTFWHFFEPDKFKGIDADRARRLGKLIPSIYEHNDRFLGEVMNSIGRETVVFVVSDHGFEASGKVPEPQDVADFGNNFDQQRAKALRDGSIAVGQSGRHNLNGLILAAGGPIRQGVPIQSSVLDITPTILALLGLPVSDEMPGRVLEEILDPEFLRAHPIRRIPSYDSLDLPLPKRGHADEEEDSRRLEMLRSLGYIR
jgi:predicted AlkP superfamily pyrophosphatase or phosphodiesterase